MKRKERLNEAFEYLRFKGIIKTQTEVAAQMGASRPNVSSALKGDTKVLTDSFIQRFARTFGLSEEWLLYGTGTMLNSTPTITQHNTYGHNINTQGPVQIGSTANDAEYAEVEEITGAPVLPASMYKASNTDLLEFVQTARNVGRSGISVDGIDVDMFVYVRDEALSPRYEKGDLVALQAYEGEATVIPGRLYAVNTRSNGMQLRILLTNDQRLRDGDYLARSFNPDTFPDYIIKREDIITIFKKVFVIKL